MKLTIVLLAVTLSIRQSQSKYVEGQLEDPVQVSDCDPFSHSINRDDSSSFEGIEVDVLSPVLLLVFGWKVLLRYRI